METIEIIVEETVQPIILEVYQENTPPILLELFEGQPGDSAYVEAVKNGFVGTESEWLESLKGDKGDVGEKGDKGDIGEKGEKGDKGDSGANAVWGDITGSLNDQVDLQNALDSKVDEVTGYSLTKNDFTDALKAKLDSITEIFTTVLKTAYDNAVTWISTNGNNLINHLSNISNPHNTTASQVGAYTTSEVDNIANSKVDKVTGKSLMLDSEITRLSTVTNFDNSGNVIALANKVDKITGKQLSTEDYTTTEKTKLSGIATGATANDTDVNLKNRANHTGSQLASTISDFATAVGLLITNKVDKITGYSLTKNDLTDALKTAYDNAVSGLATLLATGSRLITSGEITKLSNTSGTNSGDNATNSQYSGLASSKEDSANKTTSTSDSASTTKFPVFATILAYFDTSRIRTLLGISTLSGSNTGDETNATIISKLGYTPTRTFLSGSDGTTVSNTTTITPTYTQLIQGGTFGSGDVVDLLYRAISTIAKASSSSIYVYVNTTNSLATGSPLQVAILTNASRTLQMTRTMSVKGSTTRVTTSTTSANADVVLTGASTLLTINWAIDQYFIFAIGHTVASATETLTGDCFRITKN